MHSLEQLRRGELQGITRLDLNIGLDRFPEEILDLADSLEVLNLSDNRLKELPADFARLHRLKVVFFSGNPFTRMPEVLGECPSLEMVGFKSCRLEQVPGASLPAHLRWLILTDNRLDRLPESLGAHKRLQKLMLAGNRLAALPEGLADCRRLELLRLAANRLTALPTWLTELPRLAWLAFAGNPLNQQRAGEVLDHPPQVVAREQLVLGELLGQGASGWIHQAEWHPLESQPRDMAIKLFKGAMTSDGTPDSEMAACLAAGRHPNLVPMIGAVPASSDSPRGLLMERIPPSYRILAGPPTLASCTRDDYPLDCRFTPEQALEIARGTASAMAHLHHRGILHGDLYAHNLLTDAHGHCLLGDFGAASFNPGGRDHARLQRLETRAFGCLLEELVDRCSGAETDTTVQRLASCREACLAEDVSSRPAFDELAALLG